MRTIQIRLGEDTIRLGQLHRGDVVSVEGMEDVRIG